jgi:hypothetical protein
VLDALDRHSLASQRPLTLPLLREALAGLGESVARSPRDPSRQA